jgi:general secretion pathway protein D
MPLTRKMLRRPPEGADIRCPADGGRGWSGLPGARGPCFQSMISAIIVTVFVLIPFLLPGTISAARLAGEEQPVTTEPAGSPPPTASPVAASPSRVRTNPPAAAGTQPAAGNVPQKPAEAPPAKIAGAPVPQASQPAARSQVGRYVTIDFDNVDIQVFIKFISELTGRNFLIDEKVRGKVTVISPKKIAVDEVYKVFESVLEIYGFAAVPAGDVIKVIPALDARGKNQDLRLKRETDASEDKIVTQILSLQYATPDDMKKVLDPLISKTSVILAYPPTGMLIITDVLSNIQRLQDIVTALDVEGVGELITYVPLKYASATEMAKSLATVFQQQAAPGKGIVAPIKIVADERTNALIILAAENDMTKIRELLKLMDKEIPRGAGSIRVYYLQNAKAEDLVKVLTGIPQPGKPTDPKAPATAVLSKNVQIVADKSTNSLIITAETVDYLVIEDVIRKLDITRAMVYLEGLIMEVNANKSFGVGVEWSMLNNANISQVSDLGGKSVGMAGFKGTSIIPQVNSSGMVSMPSGFSLGVIGAGITIGGVLFPNIGAVLQAYQNDSDVRILSTPQLLTLDNEDAEITVGSNVPYVTRQDTTVGSTTNYSNYEYKDVGVTLKVTPQINKDGFVRMKLDQSVTKILSQSAEVDSAGNKVLTPTTLKRTAKTTVVVKSGETVVIGGMIQDDSEKGTSQVPLLGNIPLLGWLFKTKSTVNQRTNLFVFITPHIIQNPEDAGKIEKEKMEYMRIIQEGTIKGTPVRKKENKEKE